MAGPPSYPANTNFNARPSPPSTSSHSNVPFTPSATSVADSSDNELELTPVHSPGGPQYDDLPPSYDEAQHQAVHDTRNGIAPIDPNQIEAHRITRNEGPDEAEVWEYRVKGEQTDPASEREEAPDYANYRNDKATSIPVQQHGASASSSSASDLAAAMLSQALEFTRSEPNADAQYAPHLNRLIAIPENREPGQSSNEHKQFLCAYAEALRGHSVRPAEFADFLYGLNVLATATNATAQDLLNDFTNESAPSTMVQDYIRGANEAFFAPRGLTVSFRSEPMLLDSLPIPAGRRAAILADFLEVTRGAEWRAKQLYPWVEALDANVDGITTPSERVLRLHETGVRYASQRPQSDPSSHNDDYPVEKLHIYHSEEDEDPPHSIPEPPEETRHGPGHRGRGHHHHPRGHRGGHWSPFGMPGHGPFGAPGRGPFGAPGNGPFGPGRGPFGRRGRGYGGCRGPAGPSHQADSWRGNEWAEVGKELGKIGEQFGKSMGNWGIEFGKRANSWGLEVGKMASGSGSQQRGAPGPSYEQVHDDLPPSYDCPPGQDSGVFHGDRKVDPSSSTSTGDKGKSKEKDIPIDDDSDTSSISSDTSDSSDSDSDSDSDLPDTDAIFAARLQTINAEASAATQKGKKSAPEIARDRALAIEKAETEKENTELKIASGFSKRAATRDFKQRRRELKRQHKQKKRELRAVHDRKEKGKAKKSKEWKEAKKEFKEKKKELRREKVAIRKQWREGRSERVKGGRDMGKEDEVQGYPRDGGDAGSQDTMVWLVIENLGP